MATPGGLVAGPADAQSPPASHLTAFPFRCELSLGPLITFWTQVSAYSAFGRGPLPGIIREKVRQAPELAGVIEDVSIVGKHRELVDLMMSAMFPPAFWEQEYGAALFPFQLRAFYATSAFRRSLMNDDGTLHGGVNLDEQRLGTAKVLLAYELILERTYGIDLGVEVPVIFTSVDPATALERHFQLQFDWRFVEVKPVGPVPPLTEIARRQLQSGNIDVDFLRELLPPEKFVLRGFMILKAIDVTDQQVLSSLKRDLIDKESIVSNARFQSLQAKLRTLFRRPGLHLGLAAVEGDRVLVLNDAMSHDHACIFADSAHHKTSEFAGSLYERAVIQDRPLIIDDLTAWPDRTKVEDELIASGARTFVCAPLHYQDKVIGTLELISRQARRSERHTSAQARRGAAPVFHGRAAECRGARYADPGAHQGEVHGDPSGGRVAFPQGGAEQHRRPADESPSMVAPRWSRSCSRTFTPSTDSPISATLRCSEAWLSRRICSPSSAWPQP